MFIFKIVLSLFIISIAIIIEESVMRIIGEIENIHFNKGVYISIFWHWIVMIIALLYILNINSETLPQIYMNFR